MGSLSDGYPREVRAKTNHGRAKKTIYATDENGEIEAIYNVWRGGLRNLTNEKLKVKTWGKLKTA